MSVEFKNDPFPSEFELAIWCLISQIQNPVMVGGPRMLVEFVYYSSPHGILN